MYAAAATSAARASVRRALERLGLGRDDRVRRGAAREAEPGVEGRHGGGRHRLVRGSGEGLGRRGEGVRGRLGVVVGEGRLIAEHVGLVARNQPDPRSGRRMGHRRRGGVGGVERAELRRGRAAGTGMAMAARGGTRRGVAAAVAAAMPAAIAGGTAIAIAASVAGAVAAIAVTISVAAAGTAPA